MEKMYYFICKSWLKKLYRFSALEPLYCA